MGLAWLLTLPYPGPCGSIYSCLLIRCGDSASTICVLLGMTPSSSTYESCSPHALLLPGQDSLWAGSWGSWFGKWIVAGRAMVGSCSHSWVQRQTWKWNNQGIVFRTPVTSYIVNLLFILCMEQRKKGSAITERQTREQSGLDNGILPSPCLCWCKQ